MTTTAMPLVTTAAEAFDRYQAFLAEDALIQGGWHQEQDGRHLACALGVLGGEVSSAGDCPARVMPRWLAQMVPWMFDGMEPAEAKVWGSAFYAELARIDGKVPFSVIHDWHASVVGPLAIEVAEKRGRKPEVHNALAEMQFAALTGKTFSADEWRPVLKAAYADAYAYAYADAYANADANAYADADANARKAGIARLANGLVDCLKRVEVA